MDIWLTRWKGLALVTILAILAMGLGGYFPIIGSAVFAIILGMIVANSLVIPADFRPGINYAAKKLLHYSIIALGFTLSFSQVQQLGLSSLPVSVITILAAFLTAKLVGNFLTLSPKLQTLVGFGTAICGGSAIAAASPIIHADEEEIALSISTIFLFNVVAVFLFPFLGHWMQMNDAQFGLWAGTAINDTSSVVAAGYSYSNQAGDIATIVKLTRALMIIPACLIFSYLEVRKQKRLKATVEWHRIVPMFILWFLLATILTSVGLFPQQLVPAAKKISNWFMAMALAGIGCQVSFKSFVKAGVKPILTGLAAWFTVSVTSLIIQFFFM